jgi:hypothetical protein
MGNLDFVVTYVHSCTDGMLGPGDCGPVWQLGVIAGLLVLAVGALVVLRLRARLQPDNP